MIWQQETVCKSQGGQGGNSVTCKLPIMYVLLWENKLLVIAASRVLIDFLIVFHSTLYMYFCSEPV